MREYICDYIDSYVQPLVQVTLSLKTFEYIFEYIWSHLWFNLVNTNIRQQSTPIEEVGHLVSLIAWLILLFAILLGYGGVITYKQKGNVNELYYMFFVVFVMSYFPILYLIGGFVHE